MDIKELLNPKNADGSFKDYKLVVYTWYFSDEVEDTLISYKYIWGYFNKVKEIKEYLTDEVREEIKEYCDDSEEWSIEICSVNRPLPDEILQKRIKTEEKEDNSMIFCPYCGKWRYFFENDEYDTVCDVCGVSEKNYDVEKYKFYK